LLSFTLKRHVRKKRAASTKTPNPASVQKSNIIPSIRPDLHLRNHQPKSSDRLFSAPLFIQTGI
jgi:hypothetical protein